MPYQAIAGGAVTTAANERRRWNCADVDGRRDGCQAEFLFSIVFIGSPSVSLWLTCRHAKPTSRTDVRR